MKPARSRRKPPATPLPALRRLLACLLLAAPGAQVASAETVYWCKAANGNQYGQSLPCAPGMQVGTSEAVNGVAPGREVEGAAPPPPAPSMATPAAMADPAPGMQAAPASRTPEEDPLRKGQQQLLRTLAYGLVLGVIARLLKRSFWRWFLAGIALRIVLVAADVVPF